MMDEDDHSSLRAKAIRKKSSVNLSCCFNANHHRRTASFDATSSSSPIPTPRRSPSTWIKSKTNDFPEIKGKCRNFISRMARHRRHSSAEFSYDPLSYALNFDHDDPSSEDEVRAKNFTSRLPASPPRTKTMAFDNNHQLPRTSTMAAGNHELRRGFEALSASMKRSSVKEPPEMTVQQRERTAAVEKVRMSLEQEEMTPTASNREILVQQYS